MTDRNKSQPERRQFPRVKVPVYFRAASIFKARHNIYNISLGGIRIYSDELLKKGTRLELEFFLPGGKSVEAIARVVWNKKLPAGSDARYDVGLEFIHLPPTTTDELKAIIGGNLSPDK